MQMTLYPHYLGIGAHTEIGEEERKKFVTKEREREGKFGLISQVIGGINSLREDKRKRQNSRP